MVEAAAGNKDLIEVANAALVFLKEHAGTDGYGDDLWHEDLERAIGADQDTTIRAVRQLTANRSLVFCHCCGGRIYYQVAGNLQDLIDLADGVI